MRKQKEFVKDKVEARIEKQKIKTLDFEQGKCDKCNKNAVWLIECMFPPLQKTCKEHQFIMSREYSNYVYYKNKWIEIWNADTTDCSKKCIRDLREEGLQKLGIPLKDYI